jgi:hypothetical protein
MSTYRMSDGTVVKTENAQQHWNEDTYFDGRNRISKATGTQWDHQTLYKSRKGRYYLENSSQWQGSHDSAEWVSNEEAARWLLANGEDLPADLAKLEAQISE